MRTIKNLVLITGLLALNGASLAGHAPDQINYHFFEKDNRGHLRVHFTPASAAEVISIQKPALANSTIIDLNANLSTLGDYFNETIQLKIGGKMILFLLEDADLASHDATLDFSLHHYPGSFEGFQLEINSFKEIYQRPNNLVSIQAEGRAQYYHLNSEVQVCTDGIPLEQKGLSTSSKGTLSALFLLLLIVGVHKIQQKN